MGGGRGMGVYSNWFLAGGEQPKKVKMETNPLPLTQDYLAQMLGVHRSTVIRVARPLQEDGTIQYARGRITVLNRGKLEKAACECNGAIARHFDRVLPQTLERQRAYNTKGVAKRKHRLEK